MDLATAFEESARQRPNKIALFWGEREYSFEELRVQSLAVSHQLHKEFGVKRGDRIGLWLKNCPDFIPSFFGILHAGAVVVPINNFLKPQEMNFILADAGIDVLVPDSELGAQFPALAAARPGLRIFQVEAIPQSTDYGSESRVQSPESTVGASHTSPSVGRILPVLVEESKQTPLPNSLPFRGREGAPGEQELAVIIYTSGTTGRPKGAMLSHGNLLHNVESCRIVLQTVEADRFAVLLPLFHSYMLTVGMLLPLLVGGSIVLVRSLHPPRNVLQEIIQRQATILPAIPPFYRNLVSAPIPVPLPLRMCISGSAPLPAQVLKEFEAKFQIPLIEGYGLSEASPVVTKNPLDGRRKIGSIGLPIAHVEVSIQDEAGRELAANEIGELCVRGGNVMQGYWQQPEETAKAMRGAWLLTGDIGYRDADGYYFITDRKKDMLLVNGINVYPREIEEILYQFPGVKEAAVIGKADHRKGEQPIAFVAATEGVELEEKELQRFVRQRLADYKVPRKVVLLPALPRNATGKILKTALREVAVGD
jgi:long-chain acyl-CoA synthetase